VALRFVLEGRHVGRRLQKFGMLATKELYGRALIDLYAAQVVRLCDESVDDCAMCGGGMTMFGLGLSQRLELH
jgi:hypothetical protein